MIHNRLENLIDEMLEGQILLDEAMAEFEKLYIKKALARHKQHLSKTACAIGIHRHRDNLEAFLCMQGKALMVTGDWCKFPDRERAFEVRSMLPGDLVLIRGGQFHGLINSLDENVRLFMFGGYD